MKLFKKIAVRKYIFIIYLQKIDDFTHTFSILRYIDTKQKTDETMLRKQFFASSIYRHYILNYNAPWVCQRPTNYFNLIRFSSRALVCAEEKHGMNKMRSSSSSFCGF